MKEELTDILLQMLNDAKSRKFLLSVAGILLVVANKYFEFGLSTYELIVAISPAVVFIIIEGIADMITRRETYTNQG